MSQVRLEEANRVVQGMEEESREDYLLSQALHPKLFRSILTTIHQFRSEEIQHLLLGMPHSLSNQIFLFQW